MRTNPNKFILSFCSLSKWILVWPKVTKSRRLRRLSISLAISMVRALKISALNFFLTRAASMLEAYCQKSLTLPLRLGFRYKPVWSSGPNTYMSLEKDGIGSKALVCSVNKLSLWHLLIKYSEFTHVARIDSVFFLQNLNQQAGTGGTPAGEEAIPTKTLPLPRISGSFCGWLLVVTEHSQKAKPMC